MPKPMNQEQSSNKMLQKKRERDISIYKAKTHGKMKKCQKCRKKWFHTMLEQCIKCNYSFCYFCQIKQSSSNAVFNWACSLCSYINEEQYKINLYQLEDEVQGKIKMDNWFKCSACNIETDIKHNFSDSNQLFQFLNMRDLINDENSPLFNEEKPIVFEKEVHLCDACIYYLLTPPYGDITVFMRVFPSILKPLRDTDKTPDLYEYSTHSNSRNNTSESKKTISLTDNKIFEITKERASLRFEEIKTQYVINIPAEEKEMKEKPIDSKEEHDNNDLLNDSEKNSTKNNSITSDISFTLLNQYPKNYNPLTYDYLQQLKYFEEINQIQIKSFFSFIESSKVFNQHCQCYASNLSCYNSHPDQPYVFPYQYNQNANIDSQTHFTLNNNAFLNFNCGTNPFDPSKL